MRAYCGSVTLVFIAMPFGTWLPLLGRRRLLRNILQCSKNRKAKNKLLLIHHKMFLLAAESGLGYSHNLYHPLI